MVMSIYYINIKEFKMTNEKKQILLKLKGNAELEETKFSIMTEGEC
jgi:hypothetical protein